MIEDHCEISQQWVTVYVEINRRLTKTLAESGNLTVTQYRILFELCLNNGSLPGSELPPLLLLNHSSITAALNGLEEQGYIAKSPIPNNKRALCITLLEEGKSAFLKASAVIAEVLKQIWVDLSPDQVDLIIKSTKDIVSSLRNIDSGKNEYEIPSYYVTAIVHVNALWTKVLKETFRLSLTEFRILFYLAESDHKDRGVDLASSLILDTSMISMSIAKLERFDLVSREKDHFDKRNYFVNLTEEGKRVARNAHKELSTLNRTLYQDIPPEEQKKLFEIASLIYRDL